MLAHTAVLFYSWSSTRKILYQPLHASLYQPLRAETTVGRDACLSLSRALHVLACQWYTRKAAQQRTFRTVEHSGALPLLLPPQAHAHQRAA